jgi:arylsulfatase A-like enzyme
MPGTIPAGKTCDVPAAGVDFAPTFFKFAGFDKLPWKMHGRDLTPLLKDPSKKWDEPMLVTHTGRSFGKDTNDPSKMDTLETVPWWVALRHGKMKYIRTLVENEIEELYDLDRDPDELTNLALRAENRATLERLRAMTIGELRRTEAGFVDKMPVPKTAK